MSIKKKNYFINILHGNKRENHRILINERVFNLNDIKRWKLYLKLILQYINYLCDINDKDVHLLLQEIIKNVNDESRLFKKRMGYLLGDWRCF
ncbi:MAG TPA: hypothetical protein VMZ91_03195 [Candidatus Paceibacterota bacterium]|nr:hypothetical protein [Candidatus Paceibacterota bacterium]